MAHYFQISKINKELVKGVKVLSFTDNPFEDDIGIILEIPRVNFNGVFRDFFHTNSEWDADYFYIDPDQISYLLEDLRQVDLSFGGGDDYHQIFNALSSIDRNPDPEKAYFLSWSK